ncbi:hypothetical protein QVD17_03221 [Tagetes erecta]|uniref:Serine-rich protein-like protein n=1 Tax=Tagetes erecta TaxID=13708 RepID=A0AAD8P370_TARER|nr:hypothetical protein QVD17_03221 [Tagetes erecta]
MANQIQKAHSPARRHYTSSSSSSSNSFASSTSTFSTSSSSSIFQNRSSSSPSQSPLLQTARFSSNTRSISPNRPVNQSVMKRLQKPKTKTLCMCSPTSHPGSFRCSLHKNSNRNSNSPSNRLIARRSAMTNSLVRIGTVEGGDLVKRALAALIRPSSHQQRRRTLFQPRPSRLSVMSTTNEL